MSEPDGCFISEHDQSGSGTNYETKGDDGDPLDVLVISEFESVPGCMIRCRIVGAIKAEQSEKSGKDKMIRNDRYIDIPQFSNMFERSIHWMICQKI